MSLWKKAVSVGTSAALLASLLVTVAAPAALASTAVVSVGTVARGTTSTNAATFTFTENSVNAFAGAGTLIVTILDSAGGNTLSFVGTPVVTAPGSLGAVSATKSGNVLTISTTNQDPFNVEQITVSGLKIYANLAAFDGSSAATGAIRATLTGTLAGGVLSATATATGILQAVLPAGAATVDVNVTSACNFVTSGNTANFSDVSDARTITVGGGPTTTGVQPIAFAAGTSAHAVGSTVTQTVPNCSAGIASPGTVADVVVESTSGATGVVPGEQNQAAGSVTVTEQTAGYIAAGTLTFTLSPANVLFSASPSVSKTGNIGVGSTCNLSFDRTSCTVTVSAASTAVSSVTINGIMLDVGAGVAPGSAVTVAVTGSPAINVAIDSDKIATVGRVIVGVAAQPTIYINYNDQATGLISLTEQGAGFFTGGSGSNNTFGLCLTTGESFTRLPYAVVTSGDLKLLSGVVGGTSVIGTANGSSCVYWTVYTASTVASTIEIRGVDATGAVLPSGPLAGPRLSVPAGLQPGTTQARILVGLRVDVLANNASAFSSLVSFATRAFKSGVVVTALSQPTIPAGTTDSLAGNLTISETLNGQFKPGQSICVTILPRASNGVRTQDTFLKTATTNDLPVITTNSASGLLTSAVAVPGCGSQFYIDGPFSTIPFLPNPGASFRISVNQQSFGGTLGVITIANIHLITTADAAAGTVLVDVMGDVGGGAVQFESVVSNAKIGVKPAISIGAVSALGVNPTSGYSTKTPKVQAAGKYITWKFTGGAALAGQRVNVLKAVRINGAWGGPAYLKSAWADANGIVTVTMKASAGTVLNLRVQWPGAGNLGVSTSKALGAHWK
ncbi:MAG: hypothetical protein M0T75_09800 [Chloroflexi bacterium]|nr:hypothetical protein [Chloroflexota bacterium]